MDLGVGRKRVRTQVERRQFPSFFEFLKGRSGGETVMVEMEDLEERHLAKSFYELNLVVGKV